MKKAFLIVVLAAMATAVFAQNTELPRLAVVEFSTNIKTDKVNADAITVRNLVESQMVGTRKYRIITRDDIDKLLENQKIQVSSISSAENIKKLQLQNISYIVTGSVDAMGDDYAITVRVLDVSSGQFSHSDNALMGSSSRDMYNGINGLMTKFVAGMSATAGGTIVQGTVVIPTGISIEVSTNKGGDLYFQGEKITTLWDNDTHTIPIEKPGTYSLVLNPVNGAIKKTSVEITSRGIKKVDFSNIAGIVVGGTGPAGGIVFYVGDSSKSWQCLEAAPASTEFQSDWHEAVRRCNNLSIGGFSDWRLPNINELDMIYKNLKQKDLWGFSNNVYWSSSEGNYFGPMVQNFDGGNKDGRGRHLIYSVRAIRAF